MKRCAIGLSILLSHVVAADVTVPESRSAPAAPPATLTGFLPEAKVSLETLASRVVTYRRLRDLDRACGGPSADSSKWVIPLFHALSDLAARLRHGSCSEALRWLGPSDAEELVAGVSHHRY